MVSFAVRHVADTALAGGRVLPSRRKGASSGRVVATRRHFGIATSYQIDEQNGSARTTVPVVFPDAKYAALGYVPSRTGYRFLGWYDAPSGGDQVAAADQVRYGVSPVYAHWQDHVAVTFDVATNDAAMPQGWTAPYYFAGQPFGTLPVPTHPTLNFGGWYLGNDRVTSASIVPANGAALVARYVDASFTVNLNDEWRLQSPNTNPNSGDYDGVYESFSNWHQDDWGTTAAMSISLVGYSEFTLYVKCVTDDTWSYCYCRSSTGTIVPPEKSQAQLDGEARAAEYRSQGYNLDEWDEGGYMNVDVWDENWDEMIDSFSYPFVAPGMAYPGSGSDHSVGSYVPVTFTFANPAQNVITVTYYREESGDWMGEDRGFVLIPYVQGGGS